MLGRIRGILGRLGLMVGFWGMLLALHPVPLLAGNSTVILAWDNHPDPNVTSYKVYYGFERRVYPFSTNVGLRNQVEINLPLDGEKYFFSVTAENDLDAESPYSDELEFDAPPIGEVIWLETTASGVEDQAGFIHGLPTLPPLTEWILVESPIRGTLNFDGARYRYMPEPDFSGDDTIRFAVVREGMIPLIIVVWFTVEPRNDRPVATRGEFAVRWNESARVPFAGEDPDVNSLTYRVVQLPEHGTLSGEPPNVIYTPNPGFSGQDRLRFVANDGLVDSDSSEIRIAVLAVNRPPVVLPQVISVTEDTSVSLSIAATDPDEDVLTYEVTKDVTNGTLEGFPPDLIYTPRSEFIGTDRFEYTVRDGAGGVAVAGVTLMVQPANDRPVAFPSAIHLTAGVPVRLVFTAEDPDGDEVWIRITRGPTQGSLSRDGDDWYYEADGGFVGVDTLQFVANDGKSDSDPAELELRVIDRVRVGARAQRNERGEWEVVLEWGSQVGSRYQVVTRSLTGTETWMPVGEPVLADFDRLSVVVPVDQASPGAVYAVQLVLED